jgi:uncharacterized protein DUF3489
MLKSLADTHRVILANAASLDSRRALPMPSTITQDPGAIAEAVAELIENGLLAEVSVEGDDAIWRKNDVDGNTTLVVTDKGMMAIGVACGELSASSFLPVSPKIGQARTPTKTGKLQIIIGLLQRPEGAVIDELASATNWQKHSVRGAISGALKTKRGLIVSSDLVEDRGRVYRIETPEGRSDGQSGHIANVDGHALGNQP